MTPAVQRLVEAAEAVADALLVPNPLRAAPGLAISHLRDAAAAVREEAPDIAAGVAREREACAQIVEKAGGNNYGSAHWQRMQSVADAIRARAALDGASHA